MGNTQLQLDAAHQNAQYIQNWKDHIQSETPQHTVLLTRPFYLGMHKVTQQQYSTLMGTNPSHFSATGAGSTQVANQETLKHPVERVSCLDAAEFCNKHCVQEKRNPHYALAGQSVTLMTGTGYRLPTEAEWEFACRAGWTTRYWTGDRDEDVTRAAWFSVNSGERTHPVGERAANSLGLLDIHGNVWEWVQDSFEKTYYSQFATRPAFNPSFPPTVDHISVIRGGDAQSVATFGRSTFRGVYDPSGHEHSIGFRVALTVNFAPK